MGNDGKQDVRVLTVSIDEWVQLTASGVYSVARIIPQGNSMWPLIRSGKDMIEVRPVDRPLHTGDVVVFRRSDGQAVVHRIIRLEKGLVQTRGDNCAGPDEPVKREAVFGLVTRIHRGAVTFSPEGTAGIAGVIRVSVAGIRKIRNYIRK